MNAQLQFYMSDVLILLFVNIIAIWGLDLQYGVTGIYNFAFVVFQAAGAYTAGILTLGSDSANGGFQRYVGGAHLPYPLSVLAAAAVGGVLAIPIGLVGLSRLRGDYQAIVMLVVSLIATGVATSQTGLVDGPAGLALIPRPLSSLTNSETGYDWLYVGIAGVWVGVAFWIVRGITNSPLGRTLRSVRDSETAAAALGRNVARLRLLVFVVGGMLAAMSGAVYVQSLGAWSPAAWFYPETFLFFTAIVVGGTGNMLGSAIGALLVPILFLEGTRFLPDIGYPGLVDSLEWIVIGLLLLIFLWFRPRGIAPERRRRFAPNGFARAAGVPTVNLSFIGGPRSRAGKLGDASAAVRKQPEVAGDD